MPAKYPGGYTIIDLKGLNIESGGSPEPLPLEVVKTLLEAYQNGKPIILTNLAIEGGDPSSYPLNVGLMANHNYMVYSQLDEDSAPYSSLVVAFTDPWTDNPSATIQYTEI